MVALRACPVGSSKYSARTSNGSAPRGNTTRWSTCSGRTSPTLDEVIEVASLSLLSPAVAERGVRSVTSVLQGAVQRTARGEIRSDLVVEHGQRGTDRHVH